MQWPQWLVCSSLDRAIQVRALAGDIALCSWARHLTLTVPLSTHSQQRWLFNVIYGLLWQRLLTKTWPKIMCECFSSVKNFVKFPYLHIRSFRRKQLSVRGFNNIVSRRATGSHRGGGGGVKPLWTQPLLRKNFPWIVKPGRLNRP